MYYFTRKKHQLLHYLVVSINSLYIKNTFVTSAKIEKIKGKSPSAKSAYSPYNAWAEEMYLAKAIKYALSREALNLTDESRRKAINLDNELDIKLQQDSKAEVKDLAEDLIDIETDEQGETNE